MVDEDIIKNNSSKMREKTQVKRPKKLMIIKINP